MVKYFLQSWLPVGFFFGFFLIKKKKHIVKCMIPTISFDLYNTEYVCSLLDVMIANCNTNCPIGIENFNHMLKYNTYIKKQM